MRLFQYFARRIAAGCAKCNQVRQEIPEKLIRRLYAGTYGHVENLTAQEHEQKVVVQKVGALVFGLLPPVSVLLRKLVHFLTKSVQLFGNLHSRFDRVPLPIDVFFGEFHILSQGVDAPLTKVPSSFCETTTCEGWVKWFFTRLLRISTGIVVPTDFRVIISIVDFLTSHWTSHTS